MVIAVIILGTRRVNPSALFAKLFDVTPRKTAVFLGVTSNSFAKSAEGFTLLVPSIITAITIVLCMYALSLVMKNIPMGITYASFAGLTIIATVVVGIIRFNQVPNLYSLIGLAFIVIGVLMVNLLGNN